MSATRRHSGDGDVTDELVATVRRFTRERVVPAAAVHEPADTYPADLVADLAAMGLFGVTIDEAYGGLGLDLVTYTAIVEELAWGWMSVTGFLNTHVMAAFLIASFGTPEQQARLLPAMAAGEVRGAYSMSEPDAGSDVAAITTRAVRDGDEWVLNGTKAWVTNGRMAGVVAMLVRTPESADGEGSEAGRGGFSVILVEKEPGATSWGGLTVGPNVSKLGYRGIETVELSLADHRVPADAVLGGIPGRGFGQMMAAVELGRVNIAARAVGVAQRALDESLAYARTRTTFGVPIAQHQAVAFQLAEMATKVTAARLLYRQAAADKQDGGRGDLIASMAKLFCAETCWEVCQAALRIHGGNGYATDYPIERLYRDAPLMVIGDGTSEIQKLVISRRLLEAADG